MINNLNDENLNNRNLKSILYRSKNRGCKENEIILGTFIENHWQKISALELENFASLLDEFDNDISDWIHDNNKAPAKYQILIKKITEEILNKK